MACPVLSCHGRERIKGELALLAGLSYIPVSAEDGAAHSSHPPCPLLGLSFLRLLVMDAGLAGAHGGDEEEEEDEGGPGR